MVEEEKELTRKIRNSFKSGMTRAEITRKLQKKGYKLEYIDLLVGKSKSRKLLVFISIFLITLLILASIYIIPFNKKNNIQKPLIGSYLESNKLSENKSDIQITPAFISYLLNEIGVYKLHKSFFTKEPAVISLNISGTDYYSIIDRKIETLEGSKDSDIHIITSSDEVINAVLSENPNEYFRQSVQNKKTRIEITASESELLAKGYLGMYSSLV